MNYEDVVRQLLGKLGFQSHIVNLVSTEKTDDGIKVHVYVDNTMYEDVPFLSGGRVVALLQSFVKKLPDKAQDGTKITWQFEPYEKTNASEDIRKEAAEDEHKPCLLILMSQEVKKFVEVVQKDIPKEKLGKEGVPDFDEHITLLYGVNPEDIDEIKNMVSEEKPLEINVTGFDYFDNPDASVAVLKVESPALKKFHNKLAKEFEHDTKWKTFKPHITIAYLKPGERLPEDPDVKPIRKGLEDLSFKVTEVTFSSNEGKKQVTLDLKGASLLTKTVMKVGDEVVLIKDVTDSGTFRMGERTFPKGLKAVVTDIRMNNRYIKIKFDTEKFKDQETWVETGCLDIVKTSTIKIAMTEFDAGDLGILDSAVARIGHAILKSPVAIDALIGLCAAQYLVKKLKNSEATKPSSGGSGFWRE